MLLVISVLLAQQVAASVEGPLGSLKRLASRLGQGRSRGAERREGAGPRRLACGVPRFDGRRPAGTRSGERSLRPVHRHPGVGQDPEGRREPGRRGAGGHDPLLRHPQLHVDVGRHDAAAGGGVPERVLLRDGRSGVRAGRRARQVSGRRPDGGVRLARGSARSRAAGRAGRAADEGAPRQDQWRTGCRGEAADRNRRRHPYRGGDRRQHRLGPATGVHRHRRRREHLVEGAGAEQGIRHHDPDHRDDVRRGERRVRVPPDARDPDSRQAAAAQVLRGGRLARGSSQTA